MLAPERIPSKFHIYEKHHLFIRAGENIYRFNEIWREERILGKAVMKQKIVTNCARVAYPMDHSHLRDQK